MLHALEELILLEKDMQKIFIYIYIHYEDRTYYFMNINEDKQPLDQRNNPADHNIACILLYRGSVARKFSMDLKFYYNFISNFLRQKHDCAKVVYLFRGRK